MIKPKQKEGVSNAVIGVCVLYISYRVAENMVGTARMNVNDVTARRGKFAKRPVAIIAADRETPGTRASVWAHPKRTFSLKPNSPLSTCFLFLYTLSPKSIRIPPPMRVQGTI